MNSQRENRSRSKGHSISEKIQTAFVGIIFANAVILLCFLLFWSGMFSVDISGGNEPDLSKLLPDQVLPDDIIVGGDIDTVDDDNGTTQTPVGSTAAEGNASKGNSSNNNGDDGNTDMTGTGRAIEQSDDVAYISLPTGLSH